MKCFICLWDNANDIARGLVGDNPIYEAITSHNGTALCSKHIMRLSDVDVIRLSS